MQLAQSYLGDAQILTLSGRLDVEANPELDERCKRLTESQTKTLIVNLSSLEYLSSAGLRTLLSVGKGIQARNGKLILVAPDGPVRQVISLAGFDKMFTVCATMDEATNQSGRKFNITHANESGTDVLHVSGRVDAECAPDLEEAGRRILRKDYLKVVIDLSAAQYLSSAGLCALLNLAKLAQARKGRLLLCGPKPVVAQILKLSGFDKLFPIHQDLPEALAA